VKGIPAERVFTKLFSGGVVISREGTDYTVRLTPDQWERFKPTRFPGGKLIQDAIPDVSADAREFILSGYTPTEWDAMFRDDLDR
jgi:hypothetical protein